VGRCDTEGCREVVVTVETKTVIYPVSDLEQAKGLFRALLGVEPAMDHPYYVGFHIGHQEIGSTPTAIAKG
jgi:catechol 2,3-dioxygenase-like lactoylglutathione lyase family enzyme